MEFPDSRILLFAKAPIAGQVKTRLIPAIGKQQASELYTELLSGVLNRLSGIAPLQLWCAPDVDHLFFRQAAETLSVTLHRQPEGDLGQRMAYAAKDALSSADSVVLIGGDCPVLERDHLQQALTWLQGGDDAAIGPAEDGGYVLLGIRCCAAELFKGIPWGTDTVCELTRRRLSLLNWSWRELEMLWDVDRVEDLQRYQSLSQACQKKGSEPG
ncbi:MAG: TIGR04282 family arsenosugar biosynthesis glycosyltransferase [Sedimenticola sp.]|nr:TIGR04282 family arsenosugar biosynthesis glycosyltransferase [Sedimenticola sp.]